uniref:AGC-kinase C-terminal domain-containing protein n=1 Tax=Heterorhabditis bacteriophora TaxID=37862 RepID=A0A1I7WKT1_HETBA
MSGGEFDWGGTSVKSLAQRGRKPLVEQKGKSSLDLDFQYDVPIDPFIQIVS